MLFTNIVSLLYICLLCLLKHNYFKIVSNVHKLKLPHINKYLHYISVLSINNNALCKIRLPDFMNFLIFYLKGLLVFPLGTSVLLWPISDRNISSSSWPQGWSLSWKPGYDRADGKLREGMLEGLGEGTAQGHILCDLFPPKKPLLPCLQNVITLWIHW